ncbi:MAG: 4-hydroxy-tetrahydrodipicolinate reductase [Actinomycetota bacterium]|jgi:4-hydroxy-tetrahydrodipicolinate reductase
MIRVAVSGAAGRMGRLAMKTVAEAEGVELVGGYDPGHAGETIAGIRVSADRAAAASTAQVVVEFTAPGVVVDNLAGWHGLGVSAVVGTSGFDRAKVDLVRSFWTDGPSRCLLVPNFSIAAVLMMRFAELAAPHFSASEIIEMHHDRKADAPSGTALTTAEMIAAAGGRQDRAVESEELVPGARGADTGARIHSVRLPGLLARQDVIFGTPGETLTIRHDTLDRESFMPGVLLAIRGVQSLPDPVTVGLESLLGI